MKKLTVSLMTTVVFASLFGFVSLCYGVTSFSLKITNKINPHLDSGSWIDVRSICDQQQGGGKTDTYWRFNKFINKESPYPYTLTASSPVGAGKECILDKSYASRLYPNSIGVFVNFNDTEQFYCDASDDIIKSADDDTQTMDITLYKGKNSLACKVTSVE